jgi:hypothetical protein
MAQQPTQQQVHIDVPLTNMSVAYLQDPENFVAPRVFPLVPVEHQTNKYYVWDKNAWMRDQMQQRADGDESAGSGMTLSSASYSANVFALHKDIGNQTAANADAIINLERVTTRWLTRMALIRMERQWTTDFFTTGVWGTDFVGAATASTNQGVYWSNRAGSDPRADIETGKLGVLATTGMEPNTLVLGYQTFQALKQHPDIRAQLQYTSPNSITAEMLGAIFEIPRVFVSKSVYATNNEGETAAYSLIHGKSAWLGYVDPNPGPETASAGYTFVWTGVSQGMGANVAVGSFYIPQRKVQRYEIEMAWANKAVATDLGFFFSNIVQ